MGVKLEGFSRGYIGRGDIRYRANARARGGYREKRGQVDGDGR